MLDILDQTAVFSCHLWFFHLFTGEENRKRAKNRKYMCWIWPSQANIIVQTGGGIALMVFRFSL